ncbi:MAG TPA: hypothetical protein VE244_02740 [Nitrososphaeraceae archaeon]|jgi:hypothetical protein|nr:hypothetical protein [Nitrososphaeraceae archaeon]
MTPQIEELLKIPYLRRTYELYGNTEDYYKVVSGKRPLYIGGENNIFPRKLDDDFLSTETLDDMIYSDVDVAIDFNLKGYISDESTLKTIKQALIAMYYKLN